MFTHRKRLFAWTVGVVPLFACSGGAERPAAGPVAFATHDITEIQGGYAVSVADFDADGDVDVIANSLGMSDLAWLENPGWERHVIADGVDRVVNMAAADIDGDGVPEVAFQSAFAMQAANSEGINWIARSHGEPKGTWSADVVDRFETSHHVGWADLDGDGTLELLNAPLIGPASMAPTYDQDSASVFWYDQETWERHTIDDGIPGIIHRIRPVAWDDDGRDDVLVASFEGVALYRSAGHGSAMTWEKELISPGHVEAAPRLGASDVGTALTLGERIVAAVEPWHGNEVAVYTANGGAWQRRVIFEGIGRGHEIAVLDLNGDDRADIVANDNGRVTANNPDATPGVHVFFSPDDPTTGEWSYVRIESEAAMNSCVGADINGDGRPDVVCSGAGGVVRWYENLGA